MSTRTITVCDRCSTDGNEKLAPAKTVTFKVNDREYEIDVCAEHNSELDAALEVVLEWAESARLKRATPARRSRSRKRPSGADAPPVEGAPTLPSSGVAVAVDGDGDAVVVEGAASASVLPTHVVDDELPGTAAIRAWARENGFEVGERGRLSPEIHAAYHQTRQLASAASAE